MRARRLSLALLCTWAVLGMQMLVVPTRAGDIPDNPVFIRLENGWRGMYAQGNEYAAFDLIGPQVKLEDNDTYHVFLDSGLSVALSFADRDSLSRMEDLLEAHAHWEVAYWKKHSAKIRVVPRRDLELGRKDVKVTQMDLYNNAGKRITLYLVGLRGGHGVYALGFSPADKSDDARVRDVIATLRRIPRRLDAQETKRLVLEIRRGY